MNLIKSTFINLKGHKLRVFVALLWITIGIASVIVITSIGNGFKKYINNSVNDIRTKKTTVSFISNDSNSSSSSIFEKPFNTNDIETLLTLKGVDNVTPSKNSYNDGSTFNGQASYDKKNTILQASAFKKDQTIYLVNGRNITFEDANRNVILITQENAKDLFGNSKDALGKGISINGLVFEVVGVLNDDKNQASSSDLMFSSISAIVPSNSLKILTNAYYSDNSQIDALDITVKKGYDAYKIANTAIDRLNELHPGINGSYTAPDPNKIMKNLEKITGSVNKFVKLVTVVAMVVGGIGVMNIMYISVMERQREIGIRRAIGAKPRNILIQFLLESIFITVVGGIIGIIIGIIATNYVSAHMQFKAVLSLNSFLYAIIATILTGVIFGLIPAYKASKLDPIKAIYK